MAKKAYRRWTNLRVSADGTTVADERQRRHLKRRKGPGITNEQASELAKLQRRLGVRYSGAGMSRIQAENAIDNAKAALRGR